MSTKCVANDALESAPQGAHASTMTLVRVLWIGAAMLVACYSPSPTPGAPCGPGDVCPSGLECRVGICVLPGGSADAAVDACTAAPRCEGDMLVTCTGQETCAYGCSADEVAHCARLAPSNGLTPELLEGATADVNEVDDWTFDTDDGEIKKGNIILRAPGEGVIAGIGFTLVGNVGVFTANSFAVPIDSTWKVEGNNAAVLFARTTIMVAGVLDAGADSGGFGGPGGSNSNASTSTGGCRGRAGRAIESGLKGEGGGGGGGATPGGNGGASTMSGATGIGGPQCDGAPSTIPLVGGNAGGAGAGSTSNDGGGGGGALALVAMQSITITSEGAVGAPGGGGAVLSTGDGGGGGGSGGAVLLEAPVVTVEGALTANGGGGAAPTNTDGVRGYLTSNNDAPGGSYTANGITARGGDGGASTSAPTDGQTYMFTDPTTMAVTSRGGGGGGAVGRTEIKAIVMNLEGMIESPIAKRSEAVLE